MLEPRRIDQTLYAVVLNAYVHGVITGSVGTWLSRSAQAASDA